MNITDVAYYVKCVNQISVLFVVVTDGNRTTVPNLNICGFLDKTSDSANRNETKVQAYIYYTVRKYLRLKDTVNTISSDFKCTLWLYI